MTTETIEQRAERLVRQEVLCCMSHIVATLAENGGVGKVRGALDELSDQAFELAAPVDDWEEAAIQQGAKFSDIRGWFVGSIPQTFETTKDLCEAISIEPYQREVFEHWAITEWLADKLIEHGEKVDKDFGNLCIWARTTTGQMISMDSVIQQIAEELLRT